MIIIGRPSRSDFVQFEFDGANRICAWLFPAIFKKMYRKLGVKADECLYVGDGGSNELEAAETLGMKVLQAVWYLKED